MSAPTERPRAAHRSWSALAGPPLLALLAYLPGLCTARGRLPADSKLYLTLNPGGLIGQALHSWDGSQFAGWVPHQLASFAWPSGPFYWLAQRAHLAPWVTQRLWVGTILFLGGWGVLRFIRRLGFGHGAALVGALAYQLSPYVLAYVSRTSVMLLPWAALGWTLTVTLDALAERGRRRWGAVAAFAVIVGTTAGVNLTATLMLAPAVIAVIVWVAANRWVRWRDAGVVGAQLALAGALASLWWLTPLVTQGRYGANALAFSETLQATAATSTAPEVLRGLGYWLNYVYAASGTTTTAATRYLTSPVSIALSFAVVVAGLAGLLATRRSVRALAGLLLAAGVLLAVGVAPIRNPSLLLRPLAEHSRSTLALMLRSSTRAIPMISLGLGIGLAALVEHQRRAPRRRLVALAVGAACALNLPALWTGGFVDPALLHDQRPPLAWREAAGWLDQQDATAAQPGRALQLPGVESAVFEWGYTVDPPLPGLTRKPVLTRDWLPLGSPGAMDLFYAFDDRFQDRTIAPEAIAPVARLLGVDQIILAADTNSTRFASVPAAVVGEVLGRAPGLHPGPTFGTDSTLRLWSVAGGQIDRAATDAVILVGSGDGVVDAAAAGVLDGTEAVFYAADLTPALRAQLARDGARIVLTDSNRRRARQWRGAQYVWGFTESGRNDLLVADPQDARLSPFTGGDPPLATQTTAELDGGAWIQASAYGAPLDYRPASRPNRAVDGDPSTAWQIGPGGQPVGQRLVLHGLTEPLRVVQPAGSRWITALDLTIGARTVRVSLDQASRHAPGQPIDLGELAAAQSSGEPVTVTIAAVDGDPTGSVGIAELGPVRAEVTRLPSFDASSIAAAGATREAGDREAGVSQTGASETGDRQTGASQTGAVPFTVVVTRLRDARPGGVDPELGFIRQFDTPALTAPRLRVRFADSGAPLSGCTSIGTLDTVEVRVSRGSDGWATPCAPLGPIPAGTHRLTVTTATAGPLVDQIVLDDGRDHTRHGTAATVTTTGQGNGRTVSATCTECWLITGDGYSSGWTASSNPSNPSNPLHAQAGGMNAWRASSVTVSWSGDGAVRLGQWVSLAVAVAVVGVLVGGWARRRRHPRPSPWSETTDRAEAVGGEPLVATTQRRWPTRWWHGVGAAVVVGALVGGPRPLVALAALAVGAVIALTAPRWWGLLGLLGIAASAAMIVLKQWHGDYPASFDWLAHFRGTHTVTLVGVLLVCAALLAQRPADAGRSDTASQPNE